MHAHGLDSCSVNGGFRIDRARAAANQLLDEHPDLMALTVASNLMTIGAPRVLRRRDVREPEAIALVSIGDPHWAELVDSPLTTLAQPVRRLAEGAVGLLCERIAGTRTQPPRVVFDIEPRVRRSCGTAGPREVECAASTLR